MKMLPFMFCLLFVKLPFRYITLSMTSRHHNKRSYRMIHPETQRYLRSSKKKILGYLVNLYLFFFGKGLFFYPLRQKSWSIRSVSYVAARKMSDVSLGTRPRYSLVVDEDVKKPTKQTNRALHVWNKQ